LLTSGAALAATSARAEPAPLRLRLHPDRLGHAIGADFTGLSYETAQLHNPHFFAAENGALVGHFRRLGASGVLRIGGNTSAYGVWTPSGAAEADPDEAVGPDTGKAPAPRRPITPRAIDKLRGFLDATGWRLIYGLNLAGENPKIAADEADYVARAMGQRLIALQLCNEPDLFARNGLRAEGYDFEQFAAEWERFFRAVRARVPDAPFAGPDTAFNNEWLVPFAQRFKGEVQFLSQHYYAEGPPSDPSMTIARLLGPSRVLQDEFGGMARTQLQTGLPFRMAETNSCYGGGKAGVSDSFASALWGADLMYRLAAAGGEGINFHGGGEGWYTPIAGTPRTGFTARPLYYAMLLFAMAGPGTLIDVEFDNGQVPQVSAYGLKGADGAIKAVVLNKSDADVTLAVDAAASVSVLRLCAPSLDDKANTRLGGARVGADGAFAPAAPEKIASRDGRLTVAMPRASGALLAFSA